MLELGSREAAGEELVEGGALDEVPIFEPEHLHVGNAVAAELAQPEVDPLDRRPSVLEVAVEDNETADAVAAEVADDVAHDQGEGLRVEAGRARKRLAAARARLRLVAVGD